MLRIIKCGYHLVSFAADSQQERVLHMENTHGYVHHGSSRELQYAVLLMSPHEAIVRGPWKEDEDPRRLLVEDCVPCHVTT